MKTTLNIDDAVMMRTRAEAVRRGTTIGELVTAALRRELMARERSERAALDPLPSFDGGGAAVDVSDRDALHRLMEGR